MNLELGLQLFTVRNYLRDDLEAGLKRFGEMGFKNVEFASYDPEALLGEKKRNSKAVCFRNECNDETTGHEIDQFLCAGAK